jgi:hypothetical protein
MAWPRARDDIAVLRQSFIPLCQTGTVLYDTAQIGIEVAVTPTINGLPEEREVQEGCRKDVVIWAEPNMTVWDSDFKPCREPLSVMLWKVINQGDRKSQ